MERLFDESRLERLAGEMRRREFPQRVGGVFTWDVRRDKGALVFTKPDEELTVTVGSLEVAGPDAVVVGWRESHYKAVVRVELPAARTFPEFDVKTGKLEHRALCNVGGVNLGQATSRQRVTHHLSNHVAGYVEGLLSALDKLIAANWWEADKPPSTGRRTDWRPAEAKRGF